MPTQKQWNWQQKDWPDFRYDKTKLESLEASFMRAAGVFAGTIKHVDDVDKQLLTVDLISNEALKTSEIEGEMLNRDSLQSSIRRNFGLSADQRKVPPAERGIAELMVDLYRHYDRPLSHSSHTMMRRFNGTAQASRRETPSLSTRRSTMALFDLFSR